MSKLNYERKNMQLTQQSRKSIQFNRYVNSPINYSGKIISFKSNLTEDDKKVQKYIDMLERGFDSFKAEKNNQVTRAFLINLEKEDKNVQKKVLTSQISIATTNSVPVAFAIYDINKENLLKYLDLIEKLNDEDVYLTLCGVGNDMEKSPFHIFRKRDGISEKVLDLIKKSSEDCQAFFFSKKFVKSEHLGRSTLDDSKTYLSPEYYYKEQGFFKLARMYKKAKDEFEKTHTKPKVLNLIEGDINKDNNFTIIQDVKTNFNDVGGMFNVKQQLQDELIDIISNPEIKNKDKPNGVLLYGRPGTGKTLLAKAIAGEAKIPLISVSGSSFVRLYVGSGTLRVQKLYETAKKVASASPSKTAIVFIDEVDAIACERGKDSNSERETTLNQLLTEMDGVSSKENDDIKIITIAATNRNDMLDSAFMRSGRIDYLFEIDDPSRSEKARYEILKVHGNNKPFKNDNEKELLLSGLAKSTTGLSGADLAEIIKRAYRKTLKKSRTEKYITQDDINQAKIEVLIGGKKDFEQTPELFEKVLTHEAGHAISSVILNDTFPNQSMQELDCIINEPRGNAEGLTLFKPSGIGLLSLTGLIIDAAVTYSGYTAEDKIYGEHTSGVSGDLKSVTERLTQGIMKYGFGKESIKQLCIAPDSLPFELYKTDIRESLDQLSTTCFDISRKIIDFAKDFIQNYTKKYTTLSDNSNKVVEGREFIKQFMTWVKAAGKELDYQKLQNGIKTTVLRLRH